MTFLDCRPYEIGACPTCTTLGACKKQCNENFPYSYTDNTWNAETAYSLKGITSIQSEIMNYGPVVMVFNVYSDFLSYQSGVYQHTASAKLLGMKFYIESRLRFGLYLYVRQFVGAHAVKCLGWGVENGLPYWLCANSWSTSFGENGFFRIRRGINEGNIESNGATAGSPLI